jgi:hypothetical protein
MPVNSTHPDYDANGPAWARARDAFAGEDAVKAGGERYLPRLDAQTTKDYEMYLARASFFNATARTADGFVGLIFRREPTFRRPDTRSGLSQALEQFIADADMLGTTLMAYSSLVGLESVPSTCNQQPSICDRPYHFPCSSFG